jgi:hypothetical protein
MEDGLWRRMDGKDRVEEHLIEHNGEQFSHAGATSLGYMELGQALGHIGDTPMPEAILEGTFEHDALYDDALSAIVKQLLQHPSVRQMIIPIVT